MTKGHYYKLLHLYASCHYLTENRKTIPFIDENLDPFTGEWPSRKSVTQIPAGSVTLTITRINYLKYIRKIPLTVKSVVFFLYSSHVSFNAFFNNLNIAGLISVDIFAVLIVKS